MVSKQPKRPQITVTRQIHPVYAGHLAQLEVMGYDMERIITIASVAIWDVGTVIPGDKPPQDAHEHWARGRCDHAVHLVAAAEYCREPWEASFRHSPPGPLWPEAQERLKAAVKTYMEKTEAAKSE